MSQTATLEEPKAATTISDLCALAIRVPLYHQRIIEEARNTEAPVDGVGGIGRAPDIRELALGEPAPEITEAAFEKIQHLEAIVAASERIINGLADDSPRFEDIRTAIREVVGRVREYGRATLGKILSLNRIDPPARAVTTAAFKALDESVERLGELSQVPIRAQSIVATADVAQGRSAPSPGNTSASNATNTESEPGQAAAEIAGAEKGPQAFEHALPANSEQIEWSGPLTKAEMARRITGDPKARTRKVESLLGRYGIELVGGCLYRVRLDTMDKETRRKMTEST